jgi:uncharacterized protein (DUF427 family)
MKKINPVEPGPGQESVWDYPRPPRVEAVSKRIVVVFSGVTIADTVASKRVLETSHPPVYYIPQEDIAMAYLSKTSGTSFCEWKGRAIYYDVSVEGKRAERAAWSYPNPTSAFRTIKDHLAFYPALMDACIVDNERVKPQPGGFYGGWITSDIVGPFKGEPGTQGW